MAAGGGGAADTAGQNKDGQHIGDHVDKLRRHHFGQIGLERFAESEQKPGPGSSKGGAQKSCRSIRIPV